LILNNLSTQELSDFIKQKALELGFYACGISAAISFPNDAVFLKSWLAEQRNGNMHYLANHFDKRINPSLLLGGAQSLISVLLNYYPIEHQNSNSIYKVSKYAYGKDYHKVLKRKLNNLLDLIKEKVPEISARVFVDSAPLFEKRIASNAGLGWIGKNTMLIHPEAGSYFFLGEILCDLVLEYNEAVTDQCGRCTACLRACPTDALKPDKPYQMDASLCISYQTIEDKEKAVPLVGNKQWIFGCDICQEVCPWNRKSMVTGEAAFKITDFIKNATTTDWDSLMDGQFLENFSGTPLMRAKYEGLRKNIQIVKENLKVKSK